MRRSFQLMNEGEMGHHHAKRLRLVHPAENLPAHSFQLVCNIVCQREYEGSVDTLKRNVQPWAVIERHKLRLCRLGFEIHDDMLGESVLSPDFEHSKKLAEMALGKFGIDGEPDLSARLHGSNDSALRSGSRLLRWDHIRSLFHGVVYVRYVTIGNTITTCIHKTSRN